MRPLLVLFALAAVAGTACNLTGEPPAAEPPRFSETAAEAAEPPADGCGASLIPGPQRLYVNVAGERRSALLFVPTAYENESRAALIIVFPDDDSSADDFADYTALPATAEGRNFLALFAEPGAGSWEGDAADLAFARELLAALRRKACIDEQRVFATGYQEGALVANALACAGAVPGGLAVVDPPALAGCADQDPLSVIGFGSAAEATGSAGTTSADWARDWAVIDGCREPPVNQSRIPDHKLEIYTFCRPGFVVALYTIDGAGNSWPGADSMDVLSATLEIARFFGLRR